MNLMPASSPLATDRAAMPEMTATKRMSIPLSMCHPARKSKPAATCLTPKPSDVAIPTSVPMIAMTSMTSPSFPLTRSPKIGRSVERIETGSPRRWTA